MTRNNFEGFRDDYDITCPYCQHKQQQAPTTAQLMYDLDFGYTHCEHCNRELHVPIDPDSNSMTAKKPHCGSTR